MQPLFQQHSESNSDSNWVSISDLMAGLMMVFMCIAIFMMSAANKEREKVREIAQSYANNQQAIYQSLANEFKHDFTRWQAELDSNTLEITFQGADIMFKTGDSDITDSYKSAFNEFFPRYMKALSPFHTSISGIHIEGHTNSQWGEDDNTQSYFNNLRLSQKRAISVLEYLYFLDDVTQYRPWILEKIAAVGYSSSRPRLDSAGQEDAQRSKRVVFRVNTRSEQKIRAILDY